MLFSIKRLRAGLTALMFLLPLAAHAGDDWAHKKKLTFDTTQEGAEVKEAVTQLPLLVRLHSGNFTFAEAKPDGSDLRFFAADDKTPLKFHVEKFDVANELAIVWVNLPKLSANSKADSLWMHWGNPKAPPAGDSRATYDGAQVFVFHFAETDSYNDATVNVNNGKPADVKPVTGGPIGNAAAFDGTSRIDLLASSSLKLTSGGGFTFVAWVKPAVLQDGTLYEQRDGAKIFFIGLSGGVPTVSFDGSQVKAAAPLKAGVWQHMAVVGSAGKVTFYVDGIEAGSGPLTISEIAGGGAIGVGFRGELDEAMLSNTARSGAYIKAQASSQIADTPMMSFDEGDSSSGEGVSYVSILLGAVTIDGWVVIGLLIVMGIISTYVMVSKEIFLGRTNKANSAFLEHFAEKSVEMLTPGHEIGSTLAADQNMQRSSIYHLYAIGMREVKHRFDAQDKAGTPHGLSAAALDAIRAALEGSMVRENQRLNSGMVLLTIAISGGPFLGLLGTVVGVMITFAAIAAAGDVNVNAIAPGIAAALVATVAGLAVAIPALFGYNWLATRIKNVSADTQVFTDEFLTQSAELYSL